jgi:hypothetical protein
VGRTDPWGEISGTEFSTQDGRFVGRTGMFRGILHKFVALHHKMKFEFDGGGVNLNSQLKSSNLAVNNESFGNVLY